MQRRMQIPLRQMWRVNVFNTQERDVELGGGDNVILMSKHHDMHTTI